jgi:thiosulfate reductase cytochrome b subunit
MAETVTAAAAQGGKRTLRERIYRHSIPVRLTHWVNVLCLTVLLLSGLQIFNAHPALYWGSRSTFAHPFVAMKAANDEETKGVTTILGHSFNTTGVLGVSAGGDGKATERGFPRWLTLPADQALALGRRWHFFFAWLFVANGLIYLLWGLLSRHFRRDLAPSGEEVRHIGRAVIDHARLRFPHGEEARHYNVLQKLTYLVVIFVLLPLMVLTGMTMSPGLDTAFPQLLALFGGRQSARTIHFLCAFALTAFVFVHIVMVLISGVWNNIRSMITGRYDIVREADDNATISRA